MRPSDSIRPRFRQRKGIRFKQAPPAETIFRYVHAALHFIAQHQQALFIAQFAHAGHDFPLRPPRRLHPEQPPA